MSSKCPGCKQTDVKQLGVQCTVCRQCSKTKRKVYRFCCACKRVWPSDRSVESACIYENCAFRAALLSDEVINDSSSSAHECPVFRACPQCKALLTHNGRGCPNIVCPHCRMRFCFRCLRTNCLGLNMDRIHFLRFGHILPENMELCTIVKNSESQ